MLLVHDAPVLLSLKLLCVALAILPQHVLQLDLDNLLLSLLLLLCLLVLPVLLLARKKRLRLKVLLQRGAW